MASLLKNLLQNKVEAGLDHRAIVFTGIVRDYDHSTRTCTVEIVNPTGAGNILLSNRPVPEPPRGVIPGAVRIGSRAVMSCPQGNYTYATIVSIEPIGGAFVLPERTKEDILPRSSQTTGVSRALK
jgi:hypothetical protein